MGELPERRLSWAAFPGHSQGATGGGMPKLELREISAWDLIKRWNVKDYELYQIVIGRSLPTSDLFGRVKTEELLADQNGTIIRRFMNGITDIYIRMIDVLQIEREAKESYSSNIGKGPKWPLSGIYFEYMDGFWLLDRWEINLLELKKVVLDFGMPVYDRNFERAEDFRQLNEQMHSEGLIENDRIVFDAFKFALYKNFDVSLFEERLGKNGQNNINPREQYPDSSYNLTNEPGVGQLSHGQTDPDSFIKDLRFSFENDAEIKIQKPRLKAKNYKYHNLGFHRKDSKEWKDLIQILREPPHTYQLGKSCIIDAGIKTPVKKYGRRRKRLDRINTKLIGFLTDTFLVHFPEGYKLFEPCLEDGEKAYKFKFNVEIDAGAKDSSESKYERLPDNKLIDEIYKLGADINDDTKYKSKDRNMELFKSATMAALNRKCMTKEEITDALQPGGGGMPNEEIVDALQPKGAKKIEYDPYENVEDVESNY